MHTAMCGNYVKCKYDMHYLYGSGCNLVCHFTMYRKINKTGGIRVEKSELTDETVETCRKGSETTNPKRYF